MVFLGALAAGLVAVLHHGIGDNARQSWQTMGWHTLLDGRITHALDTGVSSALSMEPASGWIDGLLYALLRDAGPQVRAGCDGWLFLSEELLEVPDGRRNLAARTRLARKLSADLAARGAMLVALPVPDKAAQVPGALCGLRVSEQSRARSAEWAAAVDNAALPQVDLAHGWPVPGYWRTDTHWDRGGALFAAQRTAVAMIALAGPGDRNIRLETASHGHSRNGDLLRLANLQHAALPSISHPDWELDQTAVVAHSGDLLDDAQAPGVILAGSSYSLNSGFIDYLQHAAAREVAQMSMAGGGFAGALLELLDRHPALLRQTHIVVWEWPMRSLTLPLTDAERRYLGENRNE